MLRVFLKLLKKLYIVVATVLRYIAIYGIVVPYHD